MFSNVAYRNIASESDALERSLYLTYIPSLIKRMKENIFQIIIPEVIQPNLLFHACGATMALKIGYFKLKKNSRGVSRYLLLFSMYVILGYAVYALLCAVNPNWEIFAGMTERFEFFSVGILFIAWILFVYFGLDGMVRKRVYIYFVLIVLIIGPLLLVSPIGPRCFLGCYILSVGVLLELFSVAFPKRADEKNYIYITLFLGTMMLLFWGSIYGRVFRVERNRLQGIRDAALNADNKLVVVEWIKLPYEDYLWWPDISRAGADDKGRIQEFKDFYEIPDNVIFDFEID